MSERKYKFVGLGEVVRMFCKIALVLVVIQWLISLADVLSGGSIYNDFFDYIALTMFAGVFGSTLFTVLFYFVMEKGQVKITESTDKLTIEYTFKSIACKCEPTTLEMAKGDLLQLEVYKRQAKSNSVNQVGAKLAFKVAYELTSGSNQLGWTTTPFSTKKHDDFTKFLTKNLTLVNEETNTYRF